jgi:hypothetical protein
MNSQTELRPTGNLRIRGNLVKEAKGDDHDLAKCGREISGYRRETFHMFP